MARSCVTTKLGWMQIFAKISSCVIAKFGGEKIGKRDDPERPTADKDLNDYLKTTASVERALALRFRYEVIRVLCGFLAGCRATHITTSSPRFAISSSPSHRYYVLQWRTIALSLYNVSIRFTSHLRHLPFSTFQVGRLLPSCSKYLPENNKVRYTTPTQILMEEPPVHAVALIGPHVFMRLWR